MFGLIMCYHKLLINISLHVLNRGMCKINIQNLLVTRQIS